VTHLDEADLVRALSQRLYDDGRRGTCGIVDPKETEMRNRTLVLGVMIAMGGLQSWTQETVDQGNVLQISMVAGSTRATRLRMRAARRPPAIPSTTA
jgi:hypothetical protein